MGEEYKSAFDGEQIDAGISRILNGEVEAAARRAEESAAAAKESAQQTAQDVEVVKAAADEELARRDAEAKRKAAESGRVTAEGERVASETERKGAETGRVAEEGKRVTAETARETAETGRETAEGKRVTAETGRVDQEADRVAAEQARVDENAGIVAQATAQAEIAGTQAGIATTKAGEADSSATAADRRATDAENAAGAASSSAGAAEQARQAIEALGVQGATLPAGSDVAVEKNVDESGAVILKFSIPQGIKGDTGETGAQGVSIAKIERTGGTGAAGTTDTYTITLSDGTSSTFQVYNGKDGEGVGDMLSSTYDPQGKGEDVFAYADEAERKAKEASRPSTWTPTAADVGALPTTGGSGGTYELAELNIASVLTCDPEIKVDFRGNRLLGVNPPTTPTDATNKGYVDGKIQTGTSSPGAGASLATGSMYLVYE